jgi:Rrf2 family transcriptional regulator, iron-sulfur cluster assembly transcription factor|tara:strand:+ start:105 stop:581 length:477 start_codon:yes stop_codon:yes gene_type:complete
MRLTTKGRYAVTAMLDLTIHADDKPVSLSEISERQSISLSYLEQLFSRLRQSELVSSVRGPGGGYRLGRSSEDIYIAQIIEAVNESVDTTNCQGKGDCQGGEICLTHALWDELTAEIHNFLNGISLAHLMARRDVKNIAQRQVDQLLILSESPQAGAC